MRIRTRGPGQQPVQVEVYDTATNQYLFTDKVNFDFGYERIEDQNNGRKRPPSPCNHQYIKWTGVPTCTVRNYWFTRKGQPLYCDSVDALIDAAVLPIQTGFEAVADQAISKATKIADEISLLNNVFELDDLGSMVSKYSNLANKIAKRRDVSPGAAPNFLDWEFGVAPLARDIQTVYRNLQSVRQRIENLSSGQWKKYNFQSMSQANRAFKEPFGLGTSLMLYGNYVGSCNINVQAVIPGLHEAEFQLKVLLDVIGLHLDALVVYDAIPFTWLLDWFIPLGDQIKQSVDRRWVKVDLAGRAYVTSKTQGTGLVTGTAFVENTNPPYWYEDHAPGAFTFLRYKRRSFDFGRPKRAKPLSLSIPDFDQKKGLILASLAQARLGK